MPANPLPDTDHNTEPPALLTLAMVRRHYVPLAERTLQRMVSTGAFPAAEVRIGGKVRLWRRETIEHWIERHADRKGAA